MPGDQARPFDPYCFYPIDEDDNSEDGRTMEDYSARENPQSISHEHFQGSVRLIGSDLVLHDRPPHSDSSTLLPGQRLEPLFGIRRDPPTYNQVVFGTTTVAGQAMDTARRLLDQAHQLTTAAGIIEETHQLLNQLQTTAEWLAAAEP